VQAITDIKMKSGSFSPTDRLILVQSLAYRHNIQKHKEMLELLAKASAGDETIAEIFSSVATELFSLLTGAKTTSQTTGEKPQTLPVLVITKDEKGKIKINPESKKAIKKLRKK